MRRAAVLALTATLLIGASCSKADEDPLVGSGAVEDVGDPADDAEVQGTVELLDPGAEPRREVRFLVEAGCEQQVATVNHIELSVSVDGQDETSEQGSETDLTYRCEGVDDSRIELSSRYDDVRSSGLTGAAADQLEEFGDLLRGSSGGLTMDRQGRVVDTELPDLDVEDALPGMGDVFDQLFEGVESSSPQATPFPAEAIGLGGRWRTTSVINAGGLEATMTTEYTVTELTDDRVVADATYVMTFAPGPIDVPGVPDGAVEVVSGEYSGSGTTTWDLHLPVAFVEQVLEGELEMAVTQAREQVELAQHTRQETSIRPR